MVSIDELVRGVTSALGTAPVLGTSSRPATTEWRAADEDSAHDIVTARDGRLVKLIGDEVMFVSVDASAACDTALTLLERFANDQTVTPRGALASGELLFRGGDYYGPIVNLAARLADLAVPRELLVTPEVSAQVGEKGLRFEPAGKRMLKGFDDPVVVLTVGRA